MNIESIIQNTKTVSPGKPMGLIGKKKIDILHTPAETITQIDNDIVNLAGRMLATLEVSPGHAIAANQVGVPINLVVLDNGTAYINILVSGEGTMLVGKEGCLSIPGRLFDVKRYLDIDFQGTEIDGTFVMKKFEEFPARMWQHEFDHIQGKLLSD